MVTAVCVEVLDIALFACGLARVARFVFPYSELECGVTYPASADTWRDDAIP